MRIDQLRAHGDQPIFTRDSVRSFKNFGQFLKQWLRVMWLDALFLIIFAATAQGIYKAPYASVRNFPITFNGSGDIVYPELAYPHRGWVIPAYLSGLLSILVPVIVLCLAQIRVRSFWDWNNSVLGLLQSVVLATLFHVVTKMLIGGFRPHFLDVCMPDISLASSHNATGLNGVGFLQVMYTTEICTQPDKALLKTAVTSFPSGHATTAFSGLVYLFLYLNAHLKVWAAYRPATWKVGLVILPLLGAWLQACVLTVDQAHHWYDILAGALIGTGTSFAAYRTGYPAIWDSRINHIPLARTVEFDRLVDEIDMKHGTFTKTVGWIGPEAHVGAGAGAGAGTATGALSHKLPVPTSARSSTTVAGRQSSVGTAQDRSRYEAYPPQQPAQARHARHSNGVRGDDIV